MADLRSLQSIFDLNETDRKQQSTLALIVDVTAAHKKDVKKDYILRMKVMDESRPTDFCSVFIYSSELERLRCSIEFGDVLLLRGYKLS
jgi:regulation of enolase protein 1 (concanavalin A-like superfamily)